MIAKQNQIVMTLHSYVKQLPLNHQLLKSVIGNEGALSDADRLQNTSVISLSSLENINTNSITILGPDAIKNFRAQSFAVKFY